MKVSFFAANPHEKARPKLDEILAKGVDQVAIACAFLTGGGAELLKPHAERLGLADSFLVVAWEPPTSLEALRELHALFPGHLYIHLGSHTPEEKDVGRGLMHSKVFLTRAGGQCWLWTGSDNLTASASQGVNCEAAVVLEGAHDEQPLRDALMHLEQCRREAIVFNPDNLPPWPPQKPGPGLKPLIVHAERDVSLETLPSFVHLRPATTDYDRLVVPPGPVWLFLYPPGSLRPGTRRPKPESAYSGTITALNFTERHPTRGIPAAWQDADHVIEQDEGVFHFRGPAPHTTTPTQGVCRLERPEYPSAVWLAERPTAKVEKILGGTHLSEVDRGFEKFFTSRSVRGGHLVHRLFRGLRVTSRVPEKEVGQVENSEFLERARLPLGTQVRVVKSDVKDKFAFIYKAKYRI